MTSLPSATAFGPPSQRNRRSITSKISSFLSNKSAHINGFSIELDEPVRKYGPGDTVKGTVALNVGKPLGITHIVICLYGYVQVFKNHSRPTANPRNNSGRVATGQGKRWVSEYYGDGFASLFEEESVLCGEGRLDPKLYHFRFEIDLPSDLSLPTSIDFERGTIAYGVSATITRPSSIALTTTCDTKVYYRENIDVGRLSGPRTREVTLRPLDVDVRPKSGMRRLTSYERKRTSRTSTPSRRNHSTRTLESREETDSSRHPSTSIASSRSSSGSHNRVASVTSDLKSSRNSLDKSISVSVAPTKSGCLAGETLSILVSINHTKVIQKLHGIIVTLYRQARVDMHPNLPVVTGNRNREQHFEDYYPRSKTGLGGLSLSAAGSSQAWRKDLSQTFAPLYIDPRTLSTEVKIALQVPDEAFPSIRNVPGEMISFKYFVEVIIDIHGKLPTWPSSTSMNMSTLQQPNNPNTPRGPSTDNTDYISTAWEANFFDTAQIKREKNAVVVQCDLIIGTRDSAKDNRPRASGAIVEVTSAPPDMDPTHETDLENNGAHANVDTYGYEYADEHAENLEYYDYSYGHDYGDGYYYPYSYQSHYDPGQTYHSQIYDYVQPYPSVQIPTIPDESQLPEKERLRRAEARLLPSQPPVANRLSLTATDEGPTAPVLPNEAPYDRPQIDHHIAGQGSHILLNGRGPVHATNGHPQSMPAASGSHHMLQAPGEAARPFDQADVAVKPSDDRRDVERRYLETQADDPETLGTDSEDGPSAPSVAEVTAADTTDLSAMSVEEAAIAGVGGHGIETSDAAGESLPQYER